MEAPHPQIIHGQCAVTSRVAGGLQIPPARDILTGCLAPPGPSRGLGRRFTHAKDVPTVIGPATKHHAPARVCERMENRSCTVQTPHYIADGSLVAHRQAKMDVGDRPKIFLLKMVRGLIAPAAVPRLRASGARSPDRNRKPRSSASLLLKASEQECIALSMSAIRDASAELVGTIPRRETLRFRSMDTPNCSRRSTPRIPSTSAAARFGDGAEVDRRRLYSLQNVITLGELRGPTLRER